MQQSPGLDYSAQVSRSLVPKLMLELNEVLATQVSSARIELPQPQCL
jgi:hypothetical protein